MAIFHLHAQILGKANGNSAVAAAAYRHTAKMENIRTGQAYDYSPKRGNVHSEFAGPDTAPDWALALKSLPAPEASNAFWNEVELFETRSDAQFAREMTLALPTELTREQNIALVRDFVSENFTSKGIVADWAYHEAAGNPHAHVMSALRPLTEAGFGPKNMPLLDNDGVQVVTKSGSGKYRPFAGGPELIPALRSSWAEVQNAHLARNGFDIAVDHRSYKDQGIELDATMHRGPTADGMDRRGAASDRIVENDAIETIRRRQIMEDPATVLRLITAQKAVFDERDVAKVVHRYTSTPEDFQALYLRVGALDEQVMIATPVIDPFTDKVLERAKYTTRDVLETERKLISDTRSLSVSTGFAVTREMAGERLVAVEKANGFLFDPEQRIVIDTLTDDRAIAVMVGYAGAGKSTVMGAVRAIYEGEGRSVYGAALAGKATVGLQESAGIESRTLASWEASWKADLRRLQRGDVMVIDEAGMVSSAQMQRFVEAVNLAGAKLIVLGDARQLQPIEYGAAFRAMADKVGYSVLGGIRRQRHDYMRDASLAFGAGRYDEALQAYIQNGHVHLEDGTSAARTSMVTAWFSDWSAGADVLMLAHRNKDVFALNELARSTIKRAGGLENEFEFKATRGSRNIAVGERIVFLEKSRDLGVQNGTFATVMSIDKGVVSAETNEGHSVRFHQSEYANIDYGYAATIHKTQGATVDRAFVYGGPTLDAQLAYVALTRHRDDAQVFASATDFSGMDDFVAKLSRERLQSTTLAHEHTEDYQESVRDFAERRGVGTEETLGEWWRAKLDSMRSVLNSVVARFDRLRTIVHGRDIAATPEPAARFAERRAQDTSSSTQHRQSAFALPVLTVGVNQALSRLDTRREHVALFDTDRARKSWFTAVSFELKNGSAAGDLLSFNRAIGRIIPGPAILSIGPDPENARAALQMLSLPEDVREFFLDNWKIVYSGQLADADQTRLDAAQAVLSHAKSVGVIDDYERNRAQFLRPEQPFIAPVADWARSVDEEVADRLGASEPLVRARLDIGRLAERVWKEPAPIVSSLIDDLRLQPGLFEVRLREILDEPQAFGALLGGRSLLGRNDPARAAALQSARPLVSELGYLRDRVHLLRQSFRADEIEFRTQMRIPVEGLSPAARLLIERVGDSTSLKDLRTADDKLALAEVRQFVAVVRSRLGQSDGDGLRQDRVDRIRSVSDVKEFAVVLQTYAGARRALSAIDNGEHAASVERAIDRAQEQTRGLEI